MEIWRYLKSLPLAPFVVVAVFLIFTIPAIHWVVTGITSSSDDSLRSPAPAALANIKRACGLQPVAKAYPATRVTSVLLDWPVNPNRLVTEQPATPLPKRYNQFGCVMQQGVGITASYTVFAPVTAGVVQRYCDQLAESYHNSDSTVATASTSDQPLWYCQYHGSNSNRQEYIPFVVPTPPIPKSYLPRQETVSEVLWVTGACRLAYGEDDPSITALAVAPFAAKSFTCVEQGTINVAAHTFQKFRTVGLVDLAMLSAYCNSRHHGWYAKAPTATATDWFCVSPAVGT